MKNELVISNVRLALLLATFIVCQACRDHNDLPHIKTDTGSTLLGIDSDSDLVRDDLEIAILKRYPLSITNRQISRRAAEIYSDVMHAGLYGDASQVKAASEKMAFLVACYFDQSTMDVSKESEFIEKLILNTPERQYAYEQFNVKLSGTIQQTVESDPIACLLPQNINL